MSVGHPHADAHAASQAHADHAQAESRSAVAARSQHEAAVIGWVEGVAIGRERLDERIRALRSGRLARRLPAPGSKEDRQFVRWTAQVLLTEEMCRVEARRLGVGRSTGSCVGARRLSQIEALHLGSINAAAWGECPEMASLLTAVTAVSAPSAPAPAHREWWRVRYSLAADPSAAESRGLRPLGWTTLDDLPSPLAEAIRLAPLGTRVGPVESRLGWHVAVATETVLRPVDQFLPADDGERFREFARWLDLRRRSLLTIAEGFEHPGDPSQPDNTHRH
jgi:[acyl-carrier-protein] S-malonyltransferase